MEKQIEMLEYISKDDAVQDMLEELIDIYASRFKNTVGYTQRANVSADFERAITNLANKIYSTFANYDFKYLHNSMLSYVAMDKKVYPYLTNTKMTHSKFNIDFRTEGTLSKPADVVSIYGSKFEDFYRLEHRYSEAIDFIQENLEIFPRSTKKYIKNKIKEKEKKPKLDKITNPFEAKAFKSSFNEKYVKTQFDNWLKFFRNNGNEFDKLSSMFYLYVSIRDFYKGSEFEEASKASLDDCMISFSHNLKTVCRRFSLFQQKENMQKIASLIKSDRKFLDDFIKCSTAHDWQDNSIYFIVKIVSDTEIIKVVDQVIGENISKTHTHRPLIWENMSLELQAALIEEAKRQFFVEYTEFDLNINCLND